MTDAIACGRGVPRQDDVARGDPIVTVFSEGKTWLRVHGTEFTGDSFNPVMRSPQDKRGGRFDAVSLPRSCWLRSAHGEDQHSYAYCATDVVDCLTEVFGRLIYDRPGPRAKTMSASRFRAHSVSQVEMTSEVAALDFSNGAKWFEIIPMCDFGTTHDYETARIWSAWLRLKAFPGFRAIRYVTRLCLSEAIVFYLPFSGADPAQQSNPEFRALNTWTLSSDRGRRNVRHFARHHQITITNWRGIR